MPTNYQRRRRAIYSALGPLHQEAPAEALAVRLIKHEVVPKCGSYEVQFPDGKSVYFYWDDELGRRHPEQIGSKEARAGTSVCARRARRPQMTQAQAQRFLIWICMAPGYLRSGQSLC